LIAQVKGSLAERKRVGNVYLYRRDRKAKVGRVKVLHVISSVDPRGGGPVEGVISSSQVWIRHGHDRHILCLDPADTPWVLKSSVTTFAVGLGGRWYGALRRAVPWLRYGYTPRLTHWLKKYSKNYDAIIVNGLWNYASYGSWRALSTAERFQASVAE
jgi:hypothetical protein